MASDPEPDEVVIVRAVMRLSRALRRAAPAAELTGGGLALLLALHRTGPTSAAALARAEGLQPQSLTRLLARLARDGLIERMGDPADRRAHVITLSERGRGALSWSMGQRRRWLAAMLADRLDAGEQTELRRAADLMLRLAGPAEQESTR